LLAGATSTAHAAKAVKAPDTIGWEAISVDLLDEGAVQAQQAAHPNPMHDWTGMPFLREIAHIGPGRHGCGPARCLHADCKMISKGKCDLHKASSSVQAQWRANAG